jgi:hypothetical protein
LRRAILRCPEITMTLFDSGDGADFVAIHEGLLPGISTIDNELGWKLTLAKLAERPLSGCGPELTKCNQVALL